MFPVFLTNEMSRLSKTIFYVESFQNISPLQFKWEMQKNSSNPSFIHTDIHTHVWKGIVFWELKEKAAFKTKIINDRK